MKYGPLSYFRLGSLFPRLRSREVVRDRRKPRMILAIVPPAPTGGGSHLPFGPLSYYRLGAMYPRAVGRQFLRDRRKPRLIVASLEIPPIPPIVCHNIPMYWAGILPVTKTEELG